MVGHRGDGNEAARHQCRRRYKTRLKTGAWLSLAHRCLFIFVAGALLGVGVASPEVEGEEALHWFKQLTMVTLVSNGTESQGHDWIDTGHVDGVYHQVVTVYRVHHVREGDWVCPLPHGGKAAKKADGAPSESTPQRECKIHGKALVADGTGAHGQAGEQGGAPSPDMLKFVELRYDETETEVVLGLNEEVVDCFELRLTVPNVNREEMCRFMGAELQWQMEKITDLASNDALKATWTRLKALEEKFCESRRALYPALYRWGRLS